MQSPKFDAEFRPCLLLLVAVTQVLNFRSMYIMADLADDAAPAFANERVLVSVKAYPDGSFDMRPGFSKEGCKYRFEDSSGEPQGSLNRVSTGFAITPPSRWHFQVQAPQTHQLMRSIQRLVPSLLLTTFIH